MQNMYGSRLYITRMTMFVAIASLCIGVLLSLLFVTLSLRDDNNITHR